MRVWFLAGIILTFLKRSNPTSISARLFHLCVLLLFCWLLFCWLLRLVIVAIGCCCNWLFLQSIVIVVGVDAHIFRFFIPDDVQRDLMAVPSRAKGLVVELTYQSLDAAFQEVGDHQHE